MLIVNGCFSSKFYLNCFELISYNIATGLNSPVRSQPQLMIIHKGCELISKEIDLSPLIVEFHTSVAKLLPLPRLMVVRCSSDPRTSEKQPVKVPQNHCTVKVVSGIVDACVIFILANIVRKSLKSFTRSTSAIYSHFIFTSSS